MNKNNNNGLKKLFKTKFADFSIAAESPAIDLGAGADRAEQEMEAVAPVLGIGREEQMARMKKRLFLSMSAQEQITFAKRLAILIKAGIPIVDSLDMLKKQASSKNFAYILDCLQYEVEKGQPLSSGMEMFKNIFGDFAINIVKVGEVSGTLVQNLNYLADELKKKQELKRNIVSALIYPAFIVVMVIGITVLLTVYVFPKILPIFQSFGAQLPWTTRVLIAVSSTMQHSWIYVLIAAGLLFVIYSLLMRIPLVRRAVDRFTFSLPLLGRLFKTYHIANFTRTIGLLLKSDVGIVETLQIVSRSSGSAAYRNKFREISENVLRGEKISEAMGKDKLLFPPIVTQMTAVGEVTGNLSSSLLYLAEMHEEEMNGMTKNLSTSIEPLLMVFMGLLVGFIAISIITPIYGITQNLRH